MSLTVASPTQNMGERTFVTPDGSDPADDNSSDWEMSSEPSPEDWKRMTTDEFRGARAKAKAAEEAQVQARAAAEVRAQARAAEEAAALAQVEKERTSPIKAKAEAAIASVKVKAVNLASTIQTNDAAILAKSHISHGLRLAITTRLGVTLTFAIAGFVLVGIVGTAIGSLCGLMIGALLAVFTFGMSLPSGAVLGSGVGGAVGAAVGGASGAVIGFVGFTYRKEFHALSQRAFNRLLSSATSVQTKAQDTAKHVSKSWQSIAIGFTGGTKGKDH